MDEAIIIIHKSDIQALSKKYFGDELTIPEMHELDAMCSIRDWAHIDLESDLEQLVPLTLALVSLIGMCRGDRRKEQ